MNISWQFTWLDFSIILAIILVALLIFIVHFLIKKYDRETPVDRRIVRERWQKIAGLLEWRKEMNYKLAVIEADKLLDYILKSMYFSGETMADRLKLATYKFPRLREAWWAHKVRNQIVHDAQYIIKYGEAKKVLSLFKRALKELGAL